VADALGAGSADADAEGGGPEVDGVADATEDADPDGVALPAEL